MRGEHRLRVSRRDLDALLLPPRRKLFFDMFRRLPVYALFNVCEDTGGKCLFLRKDIEIRIVLSK